MWHHRRDLPERFKCNAMTYQQLLDALRAAAEAGDDKAAWMLGVLRQVRQ